jgi:hypothetical protein
MKVPLEFLIDSELDTQIPCPEEGLTQRRWRALHKVRYAEKISRAKAQRRKENP